MARHVSAFYHQLLDMYLATAKNNPDSFLEFRIQSNILHTKFTTTAWPNNNSLEQKKPSLTIFNPTMAQTLTINNLPLRKDVMRP